MRKRGVVKNLIREGLEAKKRKAHAEMTALIAAHPLPLIPDFSDILTELEARIIASSSEYEQIYRRVVIARTNKATPDVNAFKCASWTRLCHWFESYNTFLASIHDEMIESLLRKDQLAMYDGALMRIRERWLKIYPDLDFTILAEFGLPETITISYQSE